MISALKLIAKNAKIYPSFHSFHAFCRSEETKSIDTPYEWLADSLQSSLKHFISLPWQFTNWYIFVLLGGGRQCKGPPFHSQYLHINSLHCWLYFPPDHVYYRWTRSTYRATVDRWSTDISTDCRPICSDQLPVKYRSSIGQVSVKYRSSIGRVSVEYRSRIGRGSVKYRSSVGQVSVKYRPSIGSLTNHIAQKKIG